MVGPLLVLSAYLAGSVCFGIVVARSRGVDLREVGSGNVGATNVSRALGKNAGRAVLFLDGLKGLVPVLVARFAVSTDRDLWIAVVGVAAVLGHVLPVWHGFRGGKGAATAVGVLLGAQPLAGLGAAISFAVLKVASKRASVGSLGACLVGVAITAVLGQASWLTAMAIAISVVVFIRHADNLRRLVRGEEPPS